MHERVAAFAHCVGNSREVTFFPECFVWIHLEHDVVGSPLPWQILSEVEPGYHPFFLQP